VLASTLEIEPRTLDIKSSALVLQIHFLLVCSLALLNSLGTKFPLKSVEAKQEQGLMTMQLYFGNYQAK